MQMQGSASRAKKRNEKTDATARDPSVCVYALLPVRTPGKVCLSPPPHTHTQNRQRNHARAAFLVSPFSENVLP